MDMANKDFQLDLNNFHDALTENGIEYLYHANTVETAISYFRLGNLASREYLEKNTLPQTGQPMSDDIDKDYGIFNDLFLNFTDFHEYFKKPNRYGPILFEFKLEEIFQLLINSKCIANLTNTQPHKWRSTKSEEERWTTDYNTRLIRPYSSGRLTWPDLVINIEPPFLGMNLVNRMIIDGHPSSKNFGSNFEKVIKDLMEKQGLNFPIEHRECAIPACICKNVRSLDERRTKQFWAGGWKSTYGAIA